MKITFMEISQSQTGSYQRVIHIITEIYCIKFNISCLYDAVDLPVRIENI
jgi:hypothetical protein